MELQSPDELESIDQIYNAGRHLLDLINEVLDISRVESVALTVSMEPVSLAELIPQCLNLVTPQAREREVALIDHGGREFIVRADQQRLRQVVLNLLSNAIKFNRREGTVTLDFAVVRDHVRISVTVTGPGISAESLERPFVPFERLDAEQRGIEVTGLGLALSKQLLEAVGGTLDVRSVPGAGSTFSFELARADAIAAVEERTTRSSSAVVDHSRFKVLYIEDHRTNVELVEHLMEMRPQLQSIVH